MNKVDDLRSAQAKQLTRDFEEAESKWAAVEEKLQMKKGLQLAEAKALLARKTGKLPSDEAAQSYIKSQIDRTDNHYLKSLLNEVAPQNMPFMVVTAPTSH